MSGQLPLSEQVTSGTLWSVAGGLNIEGGFPALDLTPSAADIVAHKSMSTFYNLDALCVHDCNAGSTDSCADKYLKRYPLAIRLSTNELLDLAKVSNQDAAELKEINLRHHAADQKKNVDECLTILAEFMKKEAEIAKRPKDTGIWIKDYENRVKPPLKQPIWVNLILVLDRPLIDGVVFDDLKANVVKNKYPLLENGVLEINEAQFLTVYISTISYFMSRQKTITIHVHQAKQDAQGLIDLLKPFVNQLSDKYQCAVNWRTDDPFYKRLPATKSEMLISLSQCAGLSPLFKPGTILIPKRFIPFDVKTSTVHKSNAYQVKNEFLDHLTNIFLTNDAGKSICSVHYTFAENALKSYQSANLSKERLACVPPTKSEFWLQFEESDIVQVSDLWNPKTHDEPITVVY